MDIEQLHNDILSTQKSDKYISKHKSDPQWSTDEQGLYRYDDRIWVPDSDNLRLRILLNCHDHLSLAIMVKTRHWILSEGIIHGLMSAHLLRTIVSLAQLALGPKHHDINHMVISDNFQSRTSPGTQSPWTSSNNYHPPKDSQLS